MTKIICLALTLILFSACGGTGENPNPENQNPDETKKGVVNVYTHRHYDADIELFKKFTEQTGIEVNVKKDKADKLIELLKTEGKNSQADVLITVDAGNLYYAKSLDLLQPITSPILEANVPANLRNSENYWYALTKRARVLAYSTERLKPEQLSTYADLADPKWKGKINVRSSSNIYNQSLMASVIANLGEQAATDWAKGVVANMAREPKGNDRDQVKEVALGNGDLAIVNTYYIGKLLNSENAMEADAGKKVAVFFPNQNTTGTHINVSGAGVTANAPNKENAIKFLEFLTGEEAQKLFASSNYEYPVNPKVEASDLLKSWGEFKEDALNLDLLGQQNAKAVELFETAGWK